MESLGAKITKNGMGPGSVIEVSGVGGEFKQPSCPLDCGNSGSTMRMLAGLIAAHPHVFTLIGDHSLTMRPMERIRKPLTQMGARIDLVDGHAPMTVRGGPLHAITFATSIPSAQVKTAVLFAGLQAAGTTSLTEAIRTRDHTEHALEAFGAKLMRSAAREPEQPAMLAITGGQKLLALDATVPGDISSAAFFLCAALLFEDSNIVLDAIGMNPTRASLLDVITALGGRIKMLTVEEHHGELIGSIQVNRAERSTMARKPFEIRGALTAQVIDELPVLAAIAPYTSGGIAIRDAQELRVKESDRIALVVQNLRAMGAEVTEHPDGMDIPGGQRLHGTSIDSGTDHRIAMAFAIAALRAEGETEIYGAEAAAVSFPEFFTSLDSLAQR
jgi:3-phosphoshikimate 1-carboxyvinyltransferase